MDVDVESLWINFGAHTSAKPELFCLCSVSLSFVHTIPLLLPVEWHTLVHSSHTLGLAWIGLGFGPSE
jgi:hypothetical protein